MNREGLRLLTTIDQYINRRRSTVYGNRLPSARSGRADCGHQKLTEIQDKLTPQRTTQRHVELPTRKTNTNAAAARGAGACCSAECAGPTADCGRCAPSVMIRRGGGASQSVKGGIEERPVLGLEAVREGCPHRRATLEGEFFSWAKSFR